MEPVPQHGDLQINQDLSFSRREWRWQHFGWMGMLLLILAAMLGVFGRGWVSETQARTPDDHLAIRYERVARHGAEEILEVDLAPAAVQEGVVRVWLDRRFVQARTIESIAPEPERSTAAGDRIIYEFAADPTQPTRIAFHMNPDDIGRQSGHIGLVGGDSLRVAQIVLP